MRVLFTTLLLAASISAQVWRDNGGAEITQLPGGGCRVTIDFPHPISVIRVEHIAANPVRSYSLRRRFWGINQTGTRVWILLPGKIGSVVDTINIEYLDTTNRVQNCGKSYR